ncbi:platelet glycoprotein Ib alpha chain-like [Paramacrobiotus metropolitanus]|uniref:platelet glycoprotein Ib alpha chain-like n=1 Tax=Paramacrobiotus metropolitanus TaxID=2943436 RepID=UPI0024457262|nr:platelet glycoprotein Ib alpha chain-like [Paramacrobiotus metropolitanus]
MANTILCTVLLIQAIVSVEHHFSMGATRAPPLTAAPYTMRNPINPTNSPPVTTTPAPAPAPVPSTTGKPTTTAGTTTGSTPRYQTMDVVVITPAHTTTAKTTTADTTTGSTPQYQTMDVVVITPAHTTTATTTTTANVTTAAAVTTTTDGYTHSCYDNWSRCTPATAAFTGILWKSCAEFCQKCKGKANGQCMPYSGVCSGGYHCECAPLNLLTDDTDPTPFLAQVFFAVKDAFTCWLGL